MNRLRVRLLNISNRIALSRFDSLPANSEHSVDSYFESVSPPNSPDQTFKFGEFEILKKGRIYVFVLDSIPVGYMDLKPYRDGRMVATVDMKPEFRKKGLNYGFKFHDFALSLGPVYSDAFQSRDARSLCYRMLQSGYKIRIFDPDSGNLLDTELVPDHSAKEIKSADPSIDLYDDNNLLIKIT